MGRIRTEWDWGMGLVVATDLHTHEQMGWVYYNEVESCVIIEYLEVHEHSQRRGVASLLLNLTQQQFNKPIRLGTQSVNERARAFYKAVGFTEIGRVRLRPDSIILERANPHE
jgi:ribosomal protein S18 acetylase RimI-like enzyme